MLWLCTIVFVFCSMTVGYNEHSTDTKCIPLKDCPYVIHMVYTQKYASTTIEYLKICDCGYSKTYGPLIQCPTAIPLTPGPQSNGFDCTTWTGKKAENSEFVKNLKSINESDGNSMTGGEKSRGSRNLEKQKINLKGKYSKNLDFDDTSNSHKKYFYSKNQDVEILHPNFNKKSYRSGSFFEPPPEGPSRNYHKPPYSRRPYFPLRSFHMNNDENMINKYDFPPFNKPRFSGSPRDDMFRCGREGRRNRNRIIGGIPVALGEYPWMVLFQYINNNSIINGCGGSLINSRYILTAAHCVDDVFLKWRKIKLFRIILGEFDSSRDPDCISSPQLTECAEPSRIYGISNGVLKHPNFNRVNAVNDIALVKLDREVIFSDYIKPICLPPTDFKHDNESIIVAGWGRTESETHNKVLNKAILPIVDQGVCNRLGVTLTRSQICVGLGNGIDTCTGDSGGALMVQRMDNVEVVTYLYGIISYGFASKSCGKAPSVNTFVPFYLEWIYSTLASAD